MLLPNAPNDTWKLVLRLLDMLYKSSPQALVQCRRGVHEDRSHKFKT